jgi:hypothetical protein
MRSLRSRDGGGGDGGGGGTASRRTAAATVAAAVWERLGGTRRGVWEGLGKPRYEGLKVTRAGTRACCPFLAANRRVPRPEASRSAARSVAFSHSKRRVQLPEACRPKRCSCTGRKRRRPRGGAARLGVPARAGDDTLPLPLPLPTFLPPSLPFLPPFPSPSHSLNAIPLPFSSLSSLRIPTGGHGSPPGRPRRGWPPARPPSPPPPARPAARGPPPPAPAAQLPSGQGEGRPRMCCRCRRHRRQRRRKETRMSAPVRPGGRLTEVWALRGLSVIYGAAPRGLHAAYAVRCAKNLQWRLRH